MLEELASGGIAGDILVGNAGVCVSGSLQGGGFGILGPSAASLSLSPSQSSLQVPSILLQPADRTWVLTSWLVPSLQKAAHALLSDEPRA